MRLRTMVLVTLASLGTSACATVNPRPQWQQVETITAERTEGPILWEQTPDDAKTIQERVAGLLSDGLTRQDAVRVALLNNRRLQAAFEEIGMAKADLVQAGLPTNPSFDGFLAFPIMSANSSGSLLTFVSDLWTIPARKALFSKQAEATIQQVGVDIVVTATDAMIAYDGVLFRTAVLTLEQALLQVRSDTAARVQIRYNHGLANEIELRQAHVGAFEQQVTVTQAKKELVRGQTRLNRVLALKGVQTDYRIIDTLEGLPEDDWDTERAIAFALEHRLDLARARLQIERAERQVAFERTLVFRRVAVGPGYEGQLGKGSDNSRGPVFSFEIPLFDQNQAQIAKGEYRARQMQKVLAATEMRARQEVTDTVAEISARRREIAILEDDLKQEIAEEVAYAKKWGSRMQLNLLDLLMAREREIMLQDQYIAALWQLRQADARLHRALWGGEIM